MTTRVELTRDEAIMLARYSTMENKTKGRYAVPIEVIEHPQEEVMTEEEQLKKKRALASARYRERQKQMAFSQQ